MILVKIFFTFHEFGQIGGILGLDGNAHDRRYGEFHDLHVVCVLERGDRTGLDQELIDTDETADVTCQTHAKTKLVKFF